LDIDFNSLFFNREPITGNRLLTLLSSFNNPPLPPA